MYLIRYFQGVNHVDCQMKPDLMGNLYPGITVEREQAFIPKIKIVFNAMTVCDFGP